LATDQPETYNPALTELALGEAATVLRAMGLAAHHSVLIGGLVPGLLIPDPPAPVGAHIGSTDIDICLSLALIEGDTAEYSRIETELKKAGYRLTDQSFRWERREGAKVVVEFFCPTGDGRAPGQMFRPRGGDEPAKHNLGSNMSALTLDAGRILAADVVEVRRHVTLPNGGGGLDYTFRVTGLVGFLVAKASALELRDKSKDSYDIVWISEAWPDGPAAAGAAVRANPHFADPGVAAGIDRLLSQYETPNHVGPMSYRRFHDERDLAGDRSQLPLRAHGAIAEFRRGLEG
jgi:hypothetical protein